MHSITHNTNLQEFHTTTHPHIPPEMSATSPCAGVSPPMLLSLAQELSESNTNTKNKYHNQDQSNLGHSRKIDFNHTPNGSPFCGTDMTWGTEPRRFSQVLVAGKATFPCELPRLSSRERSYRLSHNTFRILTSY